MKKSILFIVMLTIVCITSACSGETRAKKLTTCKTPVTTANVDSDNIAYMDSCIHSLECLEKNIEATYPKESVADAIDYDDLYALKNENKFDTFLNVYNKKVNEFLELMEECTEKYGY